MKPTVASRHGQDGLDKRHQIILPVTDYDLDATLASGQVFGWEQHAEGWHGVVAGRWVELAVRPEGIQARCIQTPGDWQWLRHFLQTDVNLRAVLKTFPQDDASLQAAVQAWCGLRLLRQDPWECLAGFILSATKQITQIRQIVRQLRERYGGPVAAPRTTEVRHAFPPAARLAELSEAELRACKMGFRAPYLRTAAQRIAAGELNLEQLRGMSCEAARERLMTLPGVGEKIADCVLLFAFDCPGAFPVDVWVRRVLTQRYFRGRAVTLVRLRDFAARHFGPHAGYAQQYLFHHERMRASPSGAAAGRKSGTKS